MLFSVTVLMAFNTVKFQILVINIFINIIRAQNHLTNDCKPEQEKYVVSIRKGSTHICGGSLLRPNWVLTAAHCYERDIYVVAGLSGGGKTEVRADVKVFYPHPLYQLPPLNDIALIYLNTPISKTDYISYVDIPDKNVEEVCPDAVGIGWGRLWSGQNTLYPNKTQCFPVSILSYRYCASTIRWFNFHTLMCSLPSNGNQTCLDDYGGPVICNDVQVGVIAWQIDCAKPFIPGIYIRVNKYLEFIDSVINGSPNITKSYHWLIVVVILTSYFVVISI